MPIRTIRAPSRDFLRRRIQPKVERVDRNRLSFQPSVELVNNLRTAYQQEQVMRVHDNPHLEEIITAALASFTEQGQRIWPGLSSETPVVFMRNPIEMAQCHTGLMIGIGPEDFSINEHHLEEETTTTAMMFKILGIDESHPLYPLERIAHIDDVDASSPANTLAAHVRRRYLLGETSGLVWQETMLILEELLADLLHPLAAPPNLSAQVDFVTKSFVGCVLPEPIRKSLSEIDNVAPDNFLATAERTRRKRGEKASEEQLTKFLTLWEIDCLNSFPGLLVPEADRATEKVQLAVEGQNIIMAVVYEAKMINPKLLPWLLRFVRSPKCYNADIVIKIGAGKVMIQTNKRTFQRDPDNRKIKQRRRLVSLYGVAEALSKLEPKSWYSLKRGDRVISVFGGGTLNYDLEPTAMTTDAILQKIQQYAWLV